MVLDVYETELKLIFSLKIFPSTNCQNSVKFEVTFGELIIFFCVLSFFLTIIVGENRFEVNAPGLLAYLLAFFLFLFDHRKLYCKCFLYLLVTYIGQGAS